MTRIRTALPWVPAGLAVATVVAQISYPLLSGEALRTVTIAVVLLFCAASVTHAAWHRGVRWAAGLLGVAGGTALVVEAVGVATGFPFGRYAYAGTLGPELLGVPVLVPLAWTMMAYPCLLLGRRLARRADGSTARWAPLPAAAALASWDLFLDPQIVAEGHWTWAHPDPGLPGIDGIPITNFAGWVLTALVMCGLLHQLLPDRRLPDRRLPDRLPQNTSGPATTDDVVAELVPAALLAWTWLGSSLAAAVFLGRPAVAAWGLPLMGATVLPYLLRLRADAGRDARHPAPVGR